MSRGLIGSSPVRRKNLDLLTGSAPYVGDIRLDGQLHAQVVRSSAARGRIVAIDCAEALRAPGVVTVITADDIDDIRIPIRLPFAEAPEANRVLQPPLADGVVRYAGEPVAVVVATDPYAASDAAERVVVDLEVLDPVADLAAAERASAPLVHEACGDNTIKQFAYRYGDADAVFDAAEVVVRRRLRVHRQAAAPLETRGLVADYDPSGGVLTVWGGAKVKHFTRNLLSQVTGLDPDRVRVVEVEVGGGFGTRGEPYPEDVLVALLALRLQRPVGWCESRREHMVATNHAREQEHDFELAAAGDGRLLGFRVRGRCDHGAYVRTQGLLPAILPMLHLPGPYRWAAFSMDVDAVLTNRTPVGTYRGPGMTEATFVRERMIDVAAAELGVDPADLRRRNLIPKDALPFCFTPGPGSGEVLPITYRSGDFIRAFDELLAAAQYHELRDTGEADKPAGNDETAADDQTGNDKTGVDDDQTGNDTTGVDDDQTGNDTTGVDDDQTGNDKTGPGDNLAGNDKIGPGDNLAGNDKTGPGDNLAGNDKTGPGDNLAGNDKTGPGDNLAGNRNAELQDERVGVGLAAYVEFGSTGPFEEVDLVPQGRGVTVRCAVGSVGQGVETALAQIAAEMLGLPLDAVAVEFHDTAEIPAGFGAFASRSTVLVGNAIADAVEQVRAAAAQRLACDPGQIVLRDGAAVADGGRAVSLADIGAVRGRFEKAEMTASFGGAVCRVSVNSADGRVRVDRFALAHDVGRAVNPRLLTGQLAGAAAQGIGGALLEEIAYDENAQPLTTSFADYTLPTAAELPNVEVTILEYGCRDNPLGIKGGGEAGIVGALGAVANAVADALGPEAEVGSSSVSPARVWRALNR